jgi:hypothetical protein
MKITKSLDEVLRFLRHTSRPRVLWIDQVSINQNDTQERSEQVQGMRSIYSKAYSVVVWLGPDVSGKAALAKSLVSELSRCCVNGYQGWTHFPTDDQLQNLGKQLKYYDIKGDSHDCLELI